MATESNITAASHFFTGEDKSLVVTVLDAAGAAQDITGWALSWMVKRRKTDADADALVTKATGAGIALTTPASGICTVTVEDVDIAELLGGQLYYHELKRTDAGLETVLSYGTFVLSQAVHR